MTILGRRQNSPLTVWCIQIVITAVRQSESSPSYDYKSVYNVQVTLNNGGTNWEKGDTVTVTQNGKDYTITVEETQFSYSYQAESSCSYTTPADTASGVLDVATIVANLTSSIDALSAYSADPIGNTIVVTRTDGRDFNIMTRGGSSDNALYAIKDAVNDVSRLPPQCLDGFVLRVSNSGRSDADDCFVKFRQRMVSWTRCLGRDSSSKH